MGELYNPFPKLPKNLRQIGESDPVVRLYLEDYVNTYLKRLYPSGTQTLRAGLLLGNMELHDGIPYIFIDGALEMEDFETEGEKITFTEASWKKAYQKMEDQFPKRTIQGWFLCAGPGCQLSPLNYWKQHHQYFSGKSQLMYLNQGLEGEEAVYTSSEGGLYKLRGHHIYYERNQMMQDYMITRKDVKRIESGAKEDVVRDFRQKMVVTKEQAEERNSTAGMLGMLCGILTAVLIVGSMAFVRNYQKMEEMEGILTSVFPDGIADPEELETGPGFTIEEMPGNVVPLETEPMTEMETENQSEAVETETVVQETMAVVGMDKPVKEFPEGEGDEGDDLGEIQGRLYQVSEGETLYGICLREYGSLDRLPEICNMNGLTDVDRILAGQELMLP